MNIHRRTITAAAALAVAGVAAVAAPAGAQVGDVNVTLDTGGGSRTMVVQDLAGQPLTDIAFGDAHDKPFRVKVQDTTMTPTGFSVSAQMTNLYPEVSGVLQAAGLIPSGNLRIDPALHPLDVEGVVARVQPLVDVVLTPAALDPLCVVLTPLLGSCQVTLTDLTAKVQSVPVTVDLNALSGLPLVPGSSGNGGFTVPAYTTASPDKPDSPPAATSITLLDGSPNVAAPFLTALTTLTQTVVGALPLTDVVDQSTLISAVRTVVPTLTDSQIVALLGSPATKTVEALTPAQILAQTGTYTSYPVLSVGVPANQANGVYKGTLVVTGVG